MHQNEIVNTLMRQPCFGAMDVVSLTRLVHGSRIEVLDRKEALFCKGQPFSGRIHVILAGRIQIFLPMVNNDRPLCYLGQGEFVGEVPLLLGCNHEYTAKAYQRTHLLSLDGQSCLQCLTQHTNPDAVRDFLKVMARRQQHLMQVIETSKLKTPRQRLASYLLQCSCSPEGDTVHLPDRKQDIAAQIDCASSTLSRALSDLQSLQVIRLQRGSVQIMDRSRLMDLRAMPS
jgi:CRP-like cAMP-binding protein